jgi:cyclic lactone autoinducer peptide
MEVQTMRNISQKIMKAVSNAALLTAKVNANVSCAFIMHQPTPPAALKTLKK